MFILRVVLAAAADVRGGEFPRLRGSSDGTRPDGRPSKTGRGNC